MKVPSSWKRMVDGQQDPCPDKLTFAIFGSRTKQMLVASLSGTVQQL